MTSSRPAFGFGVAAMGSLPPESLATVLFGNVFGSLRWTYDYWGPGFDTLVEGSWTDRAINYLFAGTVPAVLILWHGIVGGRLFAREFRFFLLLGLAALLYALGRYTPVFEFVFDHVPGIDLYRRPGGRDVPDQCRSRLRLRLPGAPLSPRGRPAARRPARRARRRAPRDGRRARRRGGRERPRLRGSRGQGRRGADRGRARHDHRRGRGLDHRPIGGDAARPHRRGGARRRLHGRRAHRPQRRLAVERRAGRALRRVPRAAARAAAGPAGAQARARRAPCPGRAAARRDPRPRRRLAERVHGARPRGHDRLQPAPARRLRARGRGRRERRRPQSAPFPRHLPRLSLQPRRASSASNTSSSTGRSSACPSTSRASTGRGCSTAPAPCGSTG